MLSCQHYDYSKTLISTRVSGHDESTTMGLIHRARMIKSFISILTAILIISCIVSRKA